MGDNLFRLKDRFQRDLCLGMTHEEVITATARGELRSYKQLPQIWYQIQTKFRDEPRPKSGLLRVRQFIMKDSYSFDMDAAGLDAAYKKHYDAYCRIFDRCGLEYAIVEAHSGAMGGSQSHEFMVRIRCGRGFYRDVPEVRLRGQSREGGRAARPRRRGRSRRRPVAGRVPHAGTEDHRGIFPPSPSLPETSQMKSLVLVANEQPVLVMVRGDHQVSETKLASVLHAKEVRPAHPAEIVDRSAPALDRSVRGSQGHARAGGPGAAGAAT